MDKHKDEFPAETDVDDVLAEFDGDPLSAIRPLLHDLAMLAADFEASVSTGFVRRGVPKLALRREA